MDVNLQRLHIMVEEIEQSIQAQLGQAQRDFGHRLKVYAFYKVPDRTTSEDLVQETFMKTWRYLVRGGKIELMKAFLYHVLKNLIIDEYRKTKTVSLDALLEKGFEPSTDQTERLRNAVDGRAALHLIGQLPEKYRQVIRMKYVQDLSYREMSVLTGRSKNSLAVLAYRGLKKLRQIYFTEPVAGVKALAELGKKITQPLTY